MKIQYVQYISGEKELLYEGVELKQEVLITKTIEHDNEEFEFIRDCSVDLVKAQIERILYNDNVPYEEKA